MNKFNVGDKVKVKEKFWEIESGVYHNDYKKKLVGRILEVKSVYDNGNVDTKQDNSNDDTVWTWDKNWVELCNPIITWETLKWKDVVVYNDGSEQMVLLIENDLVFLSCIGNFESSGNSRHKKELEYNGYTIKQATPPETIEIDGIKYKKDEVENALKDLKAQG